MASWLKGAAETQRGYWENDHVYSLKLRRYWGYDKYLNHKAKNELVCEDCKDRWRSCVWLYPSLCFHSEESQAGWAPRWGPSRSEIEVGPQGGDLTVQTQKLSLTACLLVLFVCVCDALSLSICSKQRSLTLMWRSKSKMWRAQPLLSGATCPAGSKTSCCESSVRALCFTESPLSLSPLLLFPYLLSRFSSSSVFFQLPPSTLSLLFGLIHTLSLMVFPSLIYPSNICFILPRRPSSSRPIFSALALSRPPLPSPLSHVLNVTLWSSSTQPPPLLSFCNDFSHLPSPSHAAVQALQDSTFI